MLLMKMTSEQTDYNNSVKGTGVDDEGASLGRVAIHQYAPGRHRETGYHYSEVTSSGWPNPKRYQTHNNNKALFHHSISIGSINTTTMKDPLKLAQCISQCKFLNIT